MEEPSSISLTSLSPDRDFFDNLLAAAVSEGDIYGFFSLLGNVGKKLGMVKSKIGQPGGIDTPVNFCEEEEVEENLIDCYRIHHYEHVGDQKQQK